jgi:murein DD-endopeptidase MepM/ murein hydrolase activator NlpD
VVLSGLSPRNDPFTGEKSFHNGVDIAAPADSLVKVAAAGKSDP